MISGPYKAWTHGWLLRSHYDSETQNGNYFLHIEVRSCHQLVELPYVQSEASKRGIKEKHPAMCLKRPLGLINMYLNIIHVSR